MLRTFFSVLAMSVAVVAFAGKDATVKSANGDIAVTVSEDNGVISYSVTNKGVTFIEKSALGLVMDYADCSKGLSLGEVTYSQKSEEYYVPTIKQRKANYNANCMNVEVKGNFKKSVRGKEVEEEVVLFNLEWSVSNTDVAFRYNIQRPNSDQLLAARVLEEKTEFVIATGSTTFLCPQMIPMTGFAGTAPSYETGYTPDEEMGKNGWGDGYVFPCLFRNADKGWLLISETGTNGSYCGCHMKNVNCNKYAIAFPNDRECNGNGKPEPGVTLPYATPWRTITLGETLKPIAETTVAWDLVKPVYEASQEYKYGRGSWSWIIGMDPSCNYDEQKRYVDFSAEMGYESLLIDALWDVQIGRDRIKEIVDYANSKGVGIFLWYNSNGYWNHAPQSPRLCMDRSLVRRAEMKWLHEIGVRGLKIDFFGGDKQLSMQLYEDILADANDFGLEIIFHGCTLPRGWERMYPNFVAAEAVRASENLHFGQYDCDIEAFCATIHPFVRNSVGSMDFGGSTLNKYWSADNKRGNVRRTTDAFALATAVLFQSPVQHFAMAPNNLTDAPAEAIEYMKRVNTVWDEVRFIDGYPGKYVVLARRAGDKWTIVGINAEKENKKVNVDLSGFNLGDNVTVYCDDVKTGALVKKSLKVKKNIAKLEMVCGGGFVIE
ncbi:MAG: glycoside hydrolase family 97 catalytic domain-containing protein [Bacteroidia bacterium]|nr:glycoside hydrolase family 97 catalytic domain-containing protein [Bacteroidia bacterium]